MTNPLITFPIAGHVYDVNEVALVGARVEVYNYTKDERISTTSEANGEFTLDLANATTQWESGDVLYLFSTYSGRHAVARAIIGSSDSYWNDDLYMKPNDLMVEWDSGGATIKIVGISATCTSAKEISIVDKKYDTVIAALNVAANSTTTAQYGKPGLTAQNGIWVIVAAQGTTPSKQTAGTANSIGDTAANSYKNIIAVNCH